MKKSIKQIVQALWLRPAVWAVALTLLAIGLVAIERRMEVGDPADLPWLATNGIEGTIAQLSIISTSMLSAVAIVFSITIIAVNQAANAYSPRILVQYLRDTANHHVMGILIGTFLFSLFTLRGVQTTEGQEFVPVIAANGVLLLTLLSLGAFIFFLNHVGKSVQVDRAINVILSQTRTLVRTPYPHDAGEPWSNRLPSDPRQIFFGHDVPHNVVVSQSSGYVQLIDMQKLFRVACNADLTAWLHCCVGDYVLPNAPLITFSPAERMTKQIAEQASRSISLGSQQILEQDALFGIRQISDIALRAISPGINDPSTALNCIDALSALLYHWHHHADIAPNRGDQNGQLRVVAPYPDFHEALEMAFAQIRHYGESDVTVLARLLDAMEHLARHIIDPSTRTLLWRFVVEVGASASEHIQLTADRQRLNERLRRVAQLFDNDADSVLLTPKKESAQ